MLRWLPASNILGVRIQAEQSEGGERFVELGHVAADARLAFDQIDVITGLGDLQRGLNAGHPTTHHQRGRVDLGLHRHQRLVMDHAVDGGTDQGFGLVGSPGPSSWIQESCSRMLAISKR